MPIIPPASAITLPTGSFPLADIGPKYDVGIQTRDGLPIPVKNRQGATLQVSACAYVCSTKHDQEEATEIQRKDQLIQLGTSTQIDREMDQWPQISQYDWTGGQVQRVYGGPGSDPTRFWDGYGLLYPEDDYIPQQAIQLNKTFDSTTVPSEVSGGYLGASAAGGPGITGYAFLRTNSSDGHPHLVFQYGSGSQSYDTDMGAATNAQRITVDHGGIWVIDELNQLAVWNLNPGTGQLTKTVIGASLAAGSVVGLRLGASGNQIYAAISSLTGIPQSSNIRLFNLTKTGGGYATTAFVDLGFTQLYMIQDMTFLGDDLMVSLSPSDGTGRGGGATIVAYNLPTQQWRTVAKFPYQGLAFMCPIAGGLFVVAVQITGGSSGILELYLIQGTSVQDIGPLTIRDGPRSYITVSSVGFPKAVGPYATFQVLVAQGSPGAFINHIFAYDVLRGRLFKIAKVFFAVAPSGSSATISFGDQRFTPVGSGRYPGSTLTFDSQLVMAVASPVQPPPSNVLTIAELHFAIGSGGGASVAPVVTTGTDIYSSLIDFTSSQPKLFRQVEAKFSALPNDATAGVTIQAWLDQDPGNLSVTPDFMVSANGGVSPGITSLVLPINKVAVKIVYRVATAGGVVVGNTWIMAPKLQSANIKTATGWAWHVFLDLARNAKRNNQNPNDYCYQAQVSQDVPSQPLDEVAAYNFLRQLWRLRGGQVICTWPNGDRFNGLIQMLRPTSPKPFGMSFEGGVPQDRYENVIEATLREDI